MKSWRRRRLRLKKLKQKKKRLKKNGVLGMILVLNLDRYDDRNVIILIAFMFLVLIGMFYIASVLQKGMKSFVC